MWWEAHTVIPSCSCLQCSPRSLAQAARGPSWSWLQPDCSRELPGVCFFTRLPVAWLAAFFYE